MVTFDESVHVHFADEAPLKVNKLVQVKLFVYLPLFVDESNKTVTYEPSSLNVPNSNLGAGGSASLLITFN